MTDAAAGGIADRGGGRGSYRVIDINAGKFCSGHIDLNRCPYARARQSGGNNRGSTCSTCTSRRCGAEALAGTGVSDLAKLSVAVRGDDGAWAVTDAADGGIADRGGGRGSYRVIDFNAGQILQRAHSPPVNSIGWPHARARAVADSAAADFHFAIIRSATGRTHGVVR